jgi:hypothetical protein
MTAKKLSEAGEPPGTSTHRQPNPRQRVLVVDDERDVRQDPIMGELQWK